jgi:hypothetical protein
MTGEYKRSRQHWVDELHKLIDLGFEADPKKVDEQFEFCILLYNHMKQAKKE